MPARPKAAHLIQDTRPSRVPTRNGPAPAPALRHVPPPPDMAPRAVPYWHTVWRLGAFQASDAETVRMYAELQARRDFCLATLEAEGLTVPTRGGAEVVHPVFRVLKDTEARLLSLAAALGLTPEARLRLGLVAVEGRSKLQAFIDSQDAAE